MENSQTRLANRTWNPWKKIPSAWLYGGTSQVMCCTDEEPFDGLMRTPQAYWRKPISWDRLAWQTENRMRIFTCSMSDFFHPDADEWRDDAWSLMRHCSFLDWLILTKRPELIAERLPGDWEQGYPNIWLGVTVEQADYLHRVDTLAEIPAALRFVSAEPLLGPIDFSTRMQSIDWVIIGCETAAIGKRRPMDLDWARAIRDQCAAADKAHFFKQYYQGSQVIHDGVLDGVVEQQVPVSPAASLVV